MDAHPINSLAQWLILLLMGAATFFSCWGSYFSKKASLLRRFPGPKGLPFIGISWVLRKPEKIFQHLLEWESKYGPTFYMSIGPKLDLISVSAPDDLEKILTSDKLMDKSILYRNLTPWLGDGVLIAKGKIWEERRKMIAPSFHFQLLNEQFQQTFHEKSKELVEIIKETARNGEKTEGAAAVLEMHSIFTKLTLDVLCETAMGKKLDCLRGANNAYLKATIRETQLLMGRYATPWLAPEILWNLSGAGREELATRKILDSFADQVIQERRNRLVENDYKIPKSATPKIIAYEEDFYGKKKTTFLDFLLEHQAKTGGSALSDKDIRNETATLMFAGHDTTASTLTWTLYLIGLHDEQQQKVSQEIDQVFGGDLERGITSGDLSKLKYLEMCIKESLRLLPSVALAARQATEDVDLGHDNLVIPCGTTVVANIYLLHHNAQLYPSPFEYRPERFTTENCAKRHPFAFIPFSGGPRNCLGQKFAFAEIKTTLANIFRHFTVKTVDPAMKDLEVVLEIVTRPKNGVRVQFQPRNHLKGM